VITAGRGGLTNFTWKVKLESPKGNFLGLTFYNPTLSYTDVRDKYTATMEISSDIGFPVLGKLESKVGLTRTELLGAPTLTSSASLTKKFGPFKFGVNYDIINRDFNSNPLYNRRVKFDGFEAYNFVMGLALEF